MNEDQVKLSPYERLLLSNQYRILEALYPKEAEDFKKCKEIVENGYELEYDSLNLSLSSSTISRDHCQEVVDILEMYRALHDNYSRLQDKQEISKTDVQFQGFDGNGEVDAIGHLDYARFLILKEKKWEEVLEDRPTFDLNSHHRVIQMYRRMLAGWKAMGQKYDLSLEEIKCILAEKIHPEMSK